MPPAAKPPQRDPGPAAPAGPGDATLVYDRSKGRPRAAGEPARLRVLAGPRKGAEHALTDPLTTIGRGSDNVLVIPDISVSRQHSRVEREGERWVVLDQGSGNGTRVNGRPVERYPLRHGDEIEMGDTKLQFVEPGGVLVKGGTPSPAEPAEVTGARVPQKGAPRRRASLYGAVATGLAVVLAAGLVRRQQRLRAEAEAAAQGDESRAFAQKRFREAVALLQRGKWVEARDKLKIASELDGQDPEIARYLASAQAEAPRAQQLAAARAALARKDYAGARSALAGVPADSALAGSARELSQEIRVVLDAAVREAKARAESGELASAQELLEPVLIAEPSRADALAVQQAIAGQRRARAAVQARRRERQPAAAPAAPAPDMAGAVEAYLSGDLAAAMVRAQDLQGPGGERLLAELKAFDAARTDGLQKQQQDRPADAVRALEQAAAADAVIAQGRDGRPGREVRKALSALHYRLGAAQAGSDGGLPQAAAHLRAAVEDDPGNQPAQALLRQIGDRCREIYLRGYVAKDQDAEAARRDFKLVADTLPPADETARKSRRWLERLDGKATGGE